MRSARPWCLAALVAGLAGCQNPQVVDPDPVVGDRPTTLSTPTGSGRSEPGVGRVQAQVMDFADDFTLRLADMTDRIEARKPSMEARIAIHRLRYTMAHGLTVIAASANPKVAMLDAVVVMSIQRRLVEERLVPKYFEDMPWIASVFEDAEQQIQSRAAETFTPEDLAEVQRLADEWVEQNPYRYYGAYVRLNDFAKTRQQATQAATNGRSSSIFSLLFLDPLAGLDPTTRELTQTRLFAERAMYYLQRMPQLVSWQAELLYIDTASEPEVEQAMTDLAVLTGAVDRVSADVSDLRARLPEIVAREREAAIDQASARFFEGFAAERAAMLDDLAARSGELERALASFERTFHAGDDFAAQATELVGAADKLTDTINAMRGGSAGTTPGAPASNPATIADYQRTIESATALTAKLSDLVSAVDELASSDAWDQRRATIDAAAADAQVRLEASIDHAYRRAVWLVAIALGGLLAVGLVLKLVPGRARSAEKRR